MLIIGSYAKVADNTGASNVQVIGIYGGSRKKYATVGDVVRISVKSIKKDSNVKKHEMYKAAVVRTRKKVLRRDGSSVRFDDNAVVLLDGETQGPKGTRIFGPVAREIREHGFDKIVYLAPEVL